MQLYVSCNCINNVCKLTLKPVSSVKVLELSKLYSYSNLNGIYCIVSTFVLIVTLLKTLPVVGITTVLPLFVIFTVFSSVGVGGTTTSTTTSFNTLPVSGYTFKI